MSIQKNLKIDREKFNEALDEYYDLHGWERKQGCQRRTLERLGLNLAAGVQK